MLSDVQLVTHHGFKHEINLSVSWPPGSMMKFESITFSTLGIVIANDGEQIKAWWPHGNETFCSYPVAGLNPIVIRKVC